LFQATLAEFYRQEGDATNAKACLNKVMSLTTNDRDLKSLRKKILELVPIS